MSGVAVSGVATRVDGRRRLAACLVDPGPRGRGVVVVVGLRGQLARLPCAVVLLLMATVCGWFGVTRRGLLRTFGVVVAAVAAALFAMVVLTGDAHGLMVLVVLALGACSAGLTRYALRRDRRSIRTLQVPGTPVGPARHGVLIMNPKSGGGKATRFELADEARRRGIEPVVLEPGSDLVQLAEDAIDRGADVIGMAGGDGSQALVASVAMRHDVALVCIPAGTRNHFALDLGLDRDDVVGALDAFGDAVERRIDLAEVSGHVFVNNVSLGIYAKIVQSPEYRDAKRETTAKFLPELLGPDAQPYGMQFTDPAGDGARRGPADPGLEQPLRAHSVRRVRYPRPARHRDPRRLGRRAAWCGGRDPAVGRRGRRAGGTLPRLHRVRQPGVDGRVRPAGRGRDRRRGRCCSTRRSSSVRSPAPCEFGSPPTLPGTRRRRWCHRRSGGRCGRCSGPSAVAPRRSTRRSARYS